MYFGNFKWLAIAAKLQFTSLRVTIFSEFQARRAFPWLKIAKKRSGCVRKKRKQFLFISNQLARLSTYCMLLPSTGYELGGKLPTQGNKTGQLGNLTQKSLDPRIEGKIMFLKKFGPFHQSKKFSTP